MMSGLTDAVGFLTRIPVARRPGEARLGAAVPWFPVVGALVGLVAGAVYLAASEVLTAGLAAGMAITAQVLLTGAFHEDGLADVADAAGGWSTQERLAILDDPRHGTYGVLALVLTIVLRVAALASLAGWAAFTAVIAAHVLGRGTAVAVMIAVEPARPDGLGAAYTADVSRRAAGTGIAFAVVVTCAALGLAAAAAVGAAAMIGVGATRYARRAFGGLTGDLLGATEQVTEVAVLAVAVAAATA